MMMNNTQYKKILELMLDLEKKMDAKLQDQKADTAKAIITALDVSSFRLELEGYVDKRIDIIESNFDDLYNKRTGNIEEKLDA